MTDTPSSKRYLVRFTDGTEIGPLDKTALKSMAKAGRIKPDDSVSQDGSQKWFAASRVPGLLEHALESDGTIPLADVEQPIADPRVREESVARASSPSVAEPPSASDDTQQGILGCIVLVVIVLGLIVAVSKGAGSFFSRNASDTTNRGSSSSGSPEQTVAAFVAAWIKSPALAAQYLHPNVPSYARDYVANFQPSNFDGKILFETDNVITNTKTGAQRNGKTYLIRPVMKWGDGTFSAVRVRLTVDDSGKIVDVFAAS